MAELHNSLYYLDRAKGQWAAEHHKSEQDVPTMADLAPYLGDWTNRITRLVALGINYRISPASETEPQSDIATLTRDMRFKRGFCRFYPAGTRYCLHTGWAGPQSSGATAWFLSAYQNNRGLLVAALSIAAIGNLLVFTLKWVRNLRPPSNVTHENQKA